MAAKGFVISRSDPETVEITLNGKDVASLNHDSDGWQGIDTAESMVRRIAEILDIPVEEE